MNTTLAERNAPVIELVAETETHTLPALVQPVSSEQLDRVARQTPRLNRQAEAAEIAPVVSALAGLAEVERFEAFRLGNRIAAGREKAAQFDGSLHGLKDQASLSGGWDNLGKGDRRIIALDLGKLGRIKRGQVWTCADQRWRGYEWEGYQRIDIEETYPADFPLDQALRNDRFVIIPGRASRSTRCGFGVQLTTADHLLHDLGRRGFGVVTMKAFAAALMAPQQTAEKKNEAGKAKPAWKRWLLSAAKFGAVAAVLTLLILSTV